MPMLEGMNLENLAKWTCVDVCVVWWWMMNGVWFGEILYPPRVRNIGRGKPSISLTLGRREKVKPETTTSSLLISESAATGVALMISESTTTQFSSTIFASIVNHMRRQFQHQPWNCVALMISESVATQFLSMIYESAVAHVG